MLHKTLFLYRFCFDVMCAMTDAVYSLCKLTSSWELHSLPLLNVPTPFLASKVAMWQKLQEGIRELHGLPSSICSDARFQNRSKAMKYCLNLCLQDDNFQEI